MAAVDGRILPAVLRAEAATMTEWLDLRDFIWTLNTRDRNWIRRRRWGYDDKEALNEGDSEEVIAGASK